MNQILADLRRNSPKNASAQTGGVLPQTAPSVPPELRHIFQIPETPAPVPRRLAQRRYAGPHPPRSWTVSSSYLRHATSGFQTKTVGRIQRFPLPGAYYPGEQSLVATALQGLAKDWGLQRDWNRFYLYTLPSRLRSVLLAYVPEFYEPGLSAADLRLVLAGPPAEEWSEYGLDSVDPSKLNVDLNYLDLTTPLSKQQLSLKELGDVLCPPATKSETDVVESWDSAEPVAGPMKLLPNLTHLSLAIDHAYRPFMSWKQLLSFATKVPTLTHLNLSGWPEPSLTPNAKLAKVTSVMTGLTVQYGGTGPYSHSLDGDWIEASILLKKLSKALYRLEYLDLTGCADWFVALKGGERGAVENNSIDWVGDWGQVTTLRLCSGYALKEDATADQISRFAEKISIATEVQKHIRAQRSGKGRTAWIAVEKDSLSKEAKATLETQQGIV